MLRPLFAVLGAVALVLLTLSLRTAQPITAQSDALSPATEAAYTRQTYRVPMRDGTRLFTLVYTPKGLGTRYPFLLERTPYGAGPGRHLGPAPAFDRAGYIFVYQDVRGRYRSEGHWQEMTPQRAHKHSVHDVDESTDMYDTVDWLLKNIPNNNGRVGVWGISYPGFYAAAGMIDSHPAIKAVSPQAPTIDLYMGDDAYHGGAFMLAANFGFYSGFNPQPNDESDEDSGDESEDTSDDDRDRYAFFLQHPTLASLATLFTPAQRALWDDQIQHDTYDSYWQARSLAPRLKHVHCAVLTVGGWFDAEDLQGPFTTFHSLQHNNPGIDSRLVIGPWAHGGWGRGAGRRLGAVDFGSNTAEYYRRELLFPFFEQHLKDASAPRLPAATAFETGANVWRQYDRWPPRQAQPVTLYFQAGGGLSWTPPDNDDAVAVGAGAFDAYISDPAKPVPYIGFAAADVPAAYMVADQRFASARPDVLIYQTEPLSEDVTLAGPVEPHLFVSTSGTDADWIVKLIDVYPSEGNGTTRGGDSRPNAARSGYQQLIRGEPLRGKFRHGFKKPEPFVPDRVEPVTFTMPDINHRFLRGHRIMVQVQSSWFPLIDRNPQVFENIPDAQAEDFQAATQRVYRSVAEPSGLRVWRLGAAMPGARDALSAADSDPNPGPAPAPSP
jgi:uncharacterized protein